MKKGWEIKKLGDVCEFKSGTTIDSKLEKSNGEIIYAKVGDMNLEGNEDYITMSSRYVDFKSISQNQIIPVGSIVFPKRGGAIATNKKRRILQPTIVDLNTMALVPSKIIDKDYLFFWFKQIDLSDLSNGTSIPQINNYSFDNVYISYPKSISEQQRIVAILDEAFAAIAKAKANAEQNLNNAKELFESYLQGVFEKKGEGWEEKRLEEISVLISKGSSPKWQGIKYVDKPGVLFVTSENVGENTLLLEQRKYVEEKFNVSDKKSILKKGDVLTNIVGASIGRTAIFDLDDIANINQAVCLIRCNEKLLFNEYLMFLLNSPFTKQHLHDNEVNNARANLSLGFFRNLLIPLPELAKQKAIVNKVKSFHIETKKLEAIYQQKINDLEELKKSILQKAFAGELKTEKAVAI